MDLLAQYRSLAEALKLPPMQPGAVSVIESTPITDPDQVWPALQALNPTQGWLQFQSHQTAFHDGLPDPAADWGLLLAAEAVDAEGDSLTLNADGAGGWRLARLRHQPDGDGLCDEVRQLARSGEQLVYRRYWQRDPEQGLVQQRACFIGFE